MSNIYEQLISAPPTDEESLRMTADQLRRTDKIGTLAMLSGDRVLNPLGQQMQAQTASRIGSLQKSRQAAIDDAAKSRNTDVLSNYYEGNLANSAETNRLKQARNGWEEEIARANAGSRRITAEKSGLGFKDMTVTLQKDLRDMGGMARQLDAIPDYKDEWFEEIPFSSSLQSSFADIAPAFATENQKERARYWRDLKNAWELAERHELFGSALTATETAEWRKAIVNQNMESHVIRDFLGTIRGNLQSKLQSAYEGGVSERQNPESIGAFLNLETTDGMPLTHFSVGGAVDEAIQSRRDAPKGDNPYGITMLEEDGSVPALTPPGRPRVQYEVIE